MAIYRAEDESGHILRDFSSFDFDPVELMADFPDVGPIHIKWLSDRANPVTKLVAIIRPLSRVA